MYPGEAQRRTDDGWLAHEQRQMRRDRFAEVEPPLPMPAPAQPTRYRFFRSREEAMQYPVIGPLMAEELEREIEGEPPRFSLL